MLRPRARRDHVPCTPFKRKRLVTALTAVMDLRIGGLRNFISHNHLDFHPRLSSRVRRQIHACGKRWHESYGPSTAHNVLREYRYDISIDRRLFPTDVHIYRSAMRTCLAIGDITEEYYVEHLGYFTSEQYMARWRYLAKRNKVGSFL